MDTMFGVESKGTVVRKTGWACRQAGRPCAPAEDKMEPGQEASQGEGRQGVDKGKQMNFMPQVGHCPEPPLGRA